MHHAGNVRSRPVLHVYARPLHCIFSSAEEDGSIRAFVPTWLLGRYLNILQYRCQWNYCDVMRISRLSRLSPHLTLEKVKSSYTPVQFQEISSHGTKLSIAYFFLPLQLYSRLRLGIMKHGVKLVGY